MRWRLSKLDWPYAVGELVIVTAGVLVALAIDQWNSDRLDRSEERVIIQRLISDLESDLASITLGLGFLPDKRGNLQRVYAVLSNTESPPEDAAGFLDDVVGGAIYGWAQTVVSTAVYDELVGAGRFTLIRDAELRSAISGYYLNRELQADRMEERETHYPDLSYQLALRETEFDALAGLSDKQIEQLAEDAFNSGLRAHAIAELNFTRFAEETLPILEASVDDLMTELQTYLDTIQ